MDKLMAFAVAFGIAVPEIATMAKAYRIALGDLPGDLLAKAIEHVVHNWTWRNMPLPGELRRIVEAEHNERRNALGTVRAAITAHKRAMAAADETKRKADADAWWVDTARRRGISVEDLKAQAQALVEARNRPPEKPLREGFAAAVDSALSDLKQNINNGPQEKPGISPKEAENA